MSKDLDIINDGNLRDITRVPGKGFAAEVDDAFIAYMTDTDKPECEFKRGDRVCKAIYMEGDFHHPGKKGIVIGSLYEKTLGEAYLVQFEGDECAAFIERHKIKLDDGV